ncbi:hypothetical protein TNCV_2942111 [Trichonephila clavipes]|nr:hypothetical protein TNCV_2942111 [Trichonephila clavipes]
MTVLLTVSQSHTSKTSMISQEIVQSSKNDIEADSYDENEVNDEAFVPKSFDWCDVAVRRGEVQLRCRLRHLIMVQNYEVCRQKALV